jgi:hypothetical protein
MDPKSTNTKVKHDRKKTPSRERIAKWYARHWPKWMDRLFPGVLRLIAGSAFLASHCWLTYRKTTKLQRCHIIPHALGGSNHPSNFVLLSGTVHARCPNTTDRRIFIRWLLAERRQSVRQFDEAWEVAFPEHKLHRPWANRTEEDQLWFRNFSALASWLNGGGGDGLLTGLLGIEAVVAWPQEGRNPWTAFLMLARELHDRLGLGRCPSPSVVRAVLESAAIPVRTARDQQEQRQRQRQRLERLVELQDRHNSTGDNYFPRRTDSEGHRIAPAYLEVCQGISRLHADTEERHRLASELAAEWGWNPDRAVPSLAVLRRVSRWLKSEAARLFHDEGRPSMADLLKRAADELRIEQVVQEARRLLTGCPVNPL